MANANVEIVKINDNTWRVEDDFVRFFVLEGKDEALLIDSGVDTPNAKEIAQSLTKKPLSLINTHGDGDHTSGNGAFDVYWVDEEDYERCGMAEKYPNSQPLFVKDEQIIDLGDRPLKVLNIPGHTYGSIAILDINARVLYAGDSVSDAIIYMFGSHRSLPLYIKSLEKLDDIRTEFDEIYPSHGSPVVGRDAVTLVRVELKKAIDKELPRKDEELFGEEVATYQGSFCGFYMPRD